MLGSLLVTTVISLGPPELPPLPGQSTPEPEPEAPAGGSEPTPAARPTRPRPAPRPATSPAPSPAPAATGRPENGRATEPPSEGPPPDDGPAMVEPPQPASTGPELEAAPASEDRPAARPLARPLGPPGAIAGEPDGAALFRLPPPERPPYRGTGMFIGSGVAFAIALSGQIVGHSLLKRACIDPAGRGEFEGEDAGAVIGRCAQGVVPAVVLRVQAGLALFTAVGLAAGGAALAGRRHAYDDVFDGTTRGRRAPALRTAGIALLATGTVSWLTGAAVAWSLLPRCGSARCANTNRIVALTTRSLSAALVASGAGMLAYAETYRRNTVLYRRERAMSLGPTIGRHHLGLSLSSRF